MVGGLTGSWMEHLGAGGFEVAGGIQQFQYIPKCDGDIAILPLLRIVGGAASSNA